MRALFSFHLNILGLNMQSIFHRAYFHPVVPIRILSDESFVDSGVRGGAHQAIDLLVVLSRFTIDIKLFGLDLSILFGLSDLE